MDKVSPIPSNYLAIEFSPLDEVDAFDNNDWQVDNISKRKRVHAVLRLFIQAFD